MNKNLVYLTTILLGAILLQPLLAPGQIALAQVAEDSTEASSFFLPFLGSWKGAHWPRIRGGKRPLHSCSAGRPAEGREEGAGLPSR